MMKVKVEMMASLVTRRGVTWRVKTRSIDLDPGWLKFKSHADRRRIGGDVRRSPHRGFVMVSRPLVSTGNRAPRFGV